MATNEPVDDPSHKSGDENSIHRYIKDHTEQELDSKSVLNNDGNCIEDDEGENHLAQDNTINNNKFEAPSLNSIQSDSPKVDEEKHAELSGDSDAPSSESNYQNKSNDEKQTQEQLQDSTAKKHEGKGDCGASDEELEEGELKDDDDDDDDDDDEADTKSASGAGVQTVGPQNHSYRQQQVHQQHHSQNFHPNRRHISPNQQQLPELHGPFPPNHQFSNSSNNNYNYPPNVDGGMMGQIPPHMNHHPMAPGPNMGPMYPREGPSDPGSMQKPNKRCKYYTRTSNKCTWGALCRFAHRDESPEPFEVFDPRGPLHPAMPMRGQVGYIHPPMGPADRPYPAYATRGPPYPMSQHGYGPYGPPQPPPHHPSPPPLPSHSMPAHHWRQQQPHHSPIYHPSPSGSAHPPTESLSPSHPTGTVAGPESRSGSTQPSNTPGAAIAGAQSPGYTPSSGTASSAVYERKHRLAYKLAPWNDRGYPTGKYDRNDANMAVGGSRGNFYRNPYNRDPYGRDPQGPPSSYYMGGPPHSSYPSGYPTIYPSNYQGGPIGSHASHFRYMSASQRNMPPDGGRLRSSKRGHDEDESSWSDSGSDDSILGQASYGNKGHASKSSKKQHHQHASAQHPHHSLRQQEAPSSLNEPNSTDKTLDQGSGTPPGEALPEDRERQEMLLNKLKEIEDLMAKKKEEQEQEDTM